MAQVARKPKFVSTALRALRDAFPGSIVDWEVVPGPDQDYYSLGIVSGRLKRAVMSRFDMVWPVVNGVLSEDERARILGILPLRPEEFNGHDDKPKPARRRTASTSRPKPRRRSPVKA